jgi:hypothetical protein
MMLSARRLEERGRALAELLAAGVSPARLVWLDQAVREARRSDWIGPDGSIDRLPGPELRRSARRGEARVRGAESD